MDKIKNPLNGKLLSIFSKNGKNLLKNYIKIFNGGAKTRKLPIAVARKLPIAVARKLPMAMARKLPMAMARKLPMAMARKLPMAVARKLPIKKQTNKLGIPKENFRGLWYQQPKPLKDMGRSEITRHLRNFRDAWERITLKDMDLSDGRLADETTDFLRSMLEHYFSEESKQQARDYLS